MSQVLGRGEHRPWVTKWPVSSLGAMLIAAVVGIGIFTYCNTQMWTPLQQWYWVQYLNTKSFPTARGDYKLLTTVDAQGKQLMAVDADVVLGPMQGWPPFPFVLTPKARQRGAVTLKVDTVHYTSAQMNQMLLERIYEGQTPDDLIRPAWVGALLVLVPGLILTVARDRVCYALNDVKGHVPFNCFEALTGTDPWKELMQRWRSLAEKDQSDREAFRRLIFPSGNRRK